MDAIGVVEAAQLRKDRQGFQAGDQVRVHVKVIEGEKERTQVFDHIDQPWLSRQYLVARQNTHSSEKYCRGHGRFAGRYGRPPNFVMERS